MSNERDTKFAGFAELVAQELKEQDLLWIGTHIRPLTDPPVDFDYEKVKLILARRAYDLVKHTTDFLDIYELNLALDHYYDWDYLLEQVPDLTAWPGQRER